MISRRTSLGACALLMLNWSGASAHHSSAPFYDRSQTVEVEGEITEVLWNNPHIRFTMTGSDASGREREWDIETNSVSIVSRRGLTPELVKVGYRVRVAGSVGKLADNALFPKTRSPYRSGGACYSGAGRYLRVSLHCPRPGRDTQP